MAKDMADRDPTPAQQDEREAVYLKERRRQKRGPTRRIVVLVAVVAVAVALVAIFVNGNGDDAVDRQTTPSDLPGWLQEVSPPPGGEMSGAIAVSISADLVAGDREVRLVVDGVDVTSQATRDPRQREERTGPIDPGPITYDPQRVEEPLVDLRPGVHSAAAVLVEYPGGVFEQEPVEVERFEWEFEIF